MIAPESCPWAIHWGASPDSHTHCAKPAHLISVTILPEPGGLFSVETEGDPAHEGPGLAEFPGQVITWQAGDRREYTGDWPGPCPHQPCILHVGHHGRHAP